MVKETNIKTQIVHEHEKNHVNDAKEIFNKEDNQRSNIQQRLNDNTQKYAEQAERDKLHVSKAGTQDVENELDLLKLNRAARAEDRKNFPGVIEEKQKKMLTGVRDTAKEGINHKVDEVNKLEKQNEKYKEEKEAERAKLNTIDDEIHLKKREITTTYETKSNDALKDHNNKVLELDNEKLGFQLEGEKKLDELAEKRRLENIQFHDQQKGLTNSRIHANISLHDAARKDEEHGAFQAESKNIVRLFTNFKGAFAKEQRQVGSTLALMSRGRKIEFKPDLNNIFFAQRMFSDAIQNFVSPNDFFKIQQSKVTAKISEFDRELRTIQTAIEIYNNEKDDVSKNYENADKNLEEVGQLVVPFNQTNSEEFHNATRQELNNVKTGRALENTMKAPQPSSSSNQHVNGERSFHSVQN